MQKNLILIIIVFFIILGCQKKPKPNELQSHLKKAMSSFLYQSVNNDTAKVMFDVKEVLYFEEKDFYECEFNVHMVLPNKDTTGIMRARITKDFTKVIRKL